MFGHDGNACMNDFHGHKMLQHNCLQAYSCSEYSRGPESCGGINTRDQGMSWTDPTEMGLPRTDPSQLGLSGTDLWTDPLEMGLSGTDPSQLGLSGAHSGHNLLDPVWPRAHTYLTHMSDVIVVLKKQPTERRGPFTHVLGAILGSTDLRRLRWRPGSHCRLT